MTFASLVLFIWKFRDISPLTSHPMPVLFTKTPGISFTSGAMCTSKTQNLVSVAFSTENEPSFLEKWPISSRDRACTGEALDIMCQKSRKYSNPDGIMSTRQST